MTERLVPSNASELEVALDAALGARVDALPTPIAEATRPLEAPAGAVPFLAYGLGVDLWKADWPETRKREIATRAVPLHRAKGTLAAIREHASFADAAVIDAVTPPAAFFVSGGEGEDTARWRDWLKSRPEIRIFLNRNVTYESGYVVASFGDDEAFTPGGFFGAETLDEPTFFADDVNAEPYQAVLIRDGREEPVAVRKRPDPRRGRDGEIYELDWSATAGRAAFFDDVLSADGFLDGTPEVLTSAKVALGFGMSGAEDWSLIAPTDRVQDLKPDRGFFASSDPIAIYADDFWCDRFIDVDDPDRHVYFALRVMERLSDWVQPSSFLDFDRFGMADYTAELTVDMTSRAGRGDLFCDAGFCDADFAQEPLDPAPIAFLCDAIGAGKSLRDDVLLDFDITTRRSLRSARSFAHLTL